ncbi:putative glycosylphosphatidylinositol-alpha 1,2 mannosyltransferase NDAI_0H03290 [Naumovozyma dairenensis CBS 421]|uniref:Mannosyltransferase n=1 Tax=Naumovozyma dairenensis (strain ATCC 10597 / BCRC 20456 / CBS 421 / NBRC 0211 / NRRL Y-12639) TaxID=1071378 RepID=G0WFE1_NAUDC|nr:hypothetical protein NDAI_0H03290 [Naumovozyma dairenensis CBS 421]CCD26502.1 hypothetical protein NDAI_0H03290 [Naumovozyma dairenensis CBS 421]
MQLPKSLFKKLILIRVVNSLLTRTFFQADEYWQALEPAHLLAYGYGELTWDWKFEIRSYAFPFVFEITYRIIHLLTVLIGYLVEKLTFCIVELLLMLNPNDEFVWRITHELRIRSVDMIPLLEYFGVIYGPKLVMAIIAAIGEYYTIKLVQKLYLCTLDKDAFNKRDEKGSDYNLITQLVFVLTITNLFNAYIITRSFINSFEMVLTAISLYYWDWSATCSHVDSFQFFKSLTVAMFTCLQRPTNSFIWIILGVFLLINMAKQEKHIFEFIRLFISIISAFLTAFFLNSTIDFYFYKKLSFPIINFIKFNFTSSLSSFYGTAPWHFHITQSLPFVLGYSIIFFVPTLFIRSSFPSAIKKYPSQLNNPFFQIKTVIVLNIIAYSCIGHKEFRFVYSLQPLFLIMTTFFLLRLYRNEEFNQLVKLILFIGSILSLIFMTLLNFINESGSIEVMKFLHNEPYPIESVGFIMPCHSTPWQSYLHRNDIPELWSISCIPPLHLLGDTNTKLKLPNYMDESDYLYENMEEFFLKNFPPITEGEKGKHEGKGSIAKKYEWPEYLIIFQQMDDIFMRKYLEPSSYHEYKRIFNSYFHWDSRRTGDIIIYKRKANKL